MSFNESDLTTYWWQVNGAGGEVNAFEGAGSFSDWVLHARQLTRPPVAVGKTG
jgi:hypothetical protein